MAAALEPPVAGIMAKIQAHSTAKQINQIQDKPYVITQKQVQQQHFQKLKVRRQKEKEGKKVPFRVTTILFAAPRILRLFTHRVVEERDWLTGVSSLAGLK